MYKVILVDDERIIREGIAAIIDWEKHGFSLTGTAQNGVEAYELIRKNPPDVVITDIKMPVLDGLSLITKVKEHAPDIVFIILSGYGEFELANEAMKRGVKHYLLKPCNENKVTDVLEDIRNELDQKEKKEQFLKGLIMNKAYSREELAYYCSLLNIVNPGEIASKPGDDVTANRHSKLIRSIIKHVEDHLDNENLSLKQLASEVLFMDVGYLSKLFCKETGEKFSHFLLRHRMEKAKGLIQSYEADKVYEVAQRVGLGDNPQYFSQVFKKYTGYTPSEYKRKYI